MRIEPIGDSFANEVRDFALWRTVDAAAAKAIRDAFRQSGVLVFRRQSLSEEELLEFGKMIGEPDLYAETGWLSTVPEVSLLANLRDQEGAMLGGLANRPLTWHTDQSYYAKPVTGCFLYAVELPAEGGATSFSLTTLDGCDLDALEVTCDGEAVGDFSGGEGTGKVETTVAAHDFVFKTGFRGVAGGSAGARL